MKRALIYLACMVVCGRARVRRPIFLFGRPPLQ